MYKVQDQIAGAWKQVRREVRKEWGKLTEDDLEQIKSERTILVGKIRQRYDIAVEEANHQIDKWSHGRRI
jgi:uncharacterized protein YjbJ (UPF0337 family)